MYQLPHSTVYHTSINTEYYTFVQFCLIINMNVQMGEREINTKVSKNTTNHFFFAIFSETTQVVFRENRVGTTFN